MKTSFNIGLVEVENSQFQKTLFVTTFFGHCSVLPPLQPKLGGLHTSQI